MLRSARSEREILAKSAERSFHHAIEQDVFQPGCHFLTEAESYQMGITQPSAGMAV